MLTSKAKKKKRGRQPPAYGPRVCPWRTSVMQNARRA